MKKTTATVYLPVQLKEKAQEFAKKNFISLNGLVSKALTEYINNNERPRNTTDS
jgi:predicted HicB family RNase H-like nuclease